MFEKKSKNFFVLSPESLEKLNLKEIEKIQVELNQEALGNMLFENAMDKVKISSLELSQGDLLMEIAMLKMGGVL